MASKTGICPEEKLVIEKVMEEFNQVEFANYQIEFGEKSFIILFDDSSTFYKPVVRRKIDK